MPARLRQRPATCHQDMHEQLVTQIQAQPSTIPEQQLVRLGPLQPPDVPAGRIGKTECVLNVGGSVRCPSKLQKIAGTRARKQAQDIHRQRLQTHQQFLKASSGVARVTAAKDNNTGRIMSDATAVTDDVHKFYQQQAEPVSGPKTGKYLLAEALRAYPWRTGQDSYTLETQLLKHLPEVIHNMFILMWMTGHTPNKCKASLHAQL